MRQKTTIRDVARLAGVAPSTVSYVLNGTRNVTPETQQAVEEAIKQLNYRPNPTARGLASGSYMTIGVLNGHMGSDYYAIVTRGIQQGLINTKYHPIIAGREDPEIDATSTVETLLNRGVEGLVVMDHSLPDAVITDLASQYPLITINRIVPGLEKYALLIDDYTGGYRATQYLIDLGHEQIIHIMTDTHFPGAHERVDGYRQALLDNDLTFDQQLVIGNGSSPESALQAMQGALTDGLKFTAVFASGDHLAMGAMVALYHKGLTVPHDISVIGYDGHTYAAYTVPPLTTIRQPMVEVGIRAVRAVLKMVKDEPVKLPLARVPVELIVRESATALRPK